MAKVLISDGYTVEDEFPGQHWIPKFKFKFRPAVPQRSTEYFHVIRGGSASEKCKERAKLMKEHLVSWEVENDRDDAVADFKKDEVLAKTPDPVIEFITTCITNYGPTHGRDDSKN